MANTVIFEEVAALAKKLTQEDQKRLAQTLLQAITSEESNEPKLKWSDLRGIMPYPMCGEDAQAWVSRTRQESDEHRQKQLRPTS